MSYVTSTGMIRLHSSHSMSQYNSHSMSQYNSHSMAVVHTLLNHSMVVVNHSNMEHSTEAAHSSEDPTATVSSTCLYMVQKTALRSLGSFTILSKHVRTFNIAWEGR